jgi:hypothetical protein
MNPNLRAQLLQAASPLAERLGEIGRFQVEADFVRRRLHGPSVLPGCYSRRFVWHRPSALAGGPAPFDLVWSIIRDQRARDPSDLDPDERMFELWNRYAPTHRRRIAEFERLLAEQYRCWFGADLPPGASAREDVWYTVAAGTVWVGRRELRGEIRHSLQVEFKTDWNDRHGDTPGFLWDEAAGRFVPPAPDAE